MTEEHITMSHGEIDRLSLIQPLDQKQIRQAEVAKRLKLSIRQIKRLLCRYRAKGAAGLVSNHRGRRANNAISDSIRQAAMALVRTQYTDFSPTFAHEKLIEVHQFKFSVETLRQWMIADQLWSTQHRKPMRVHQRRPRRPCFGELIQIDGSPHDWFEGRGEYGTLIVFIDDATSRLTPLQFAPAETTQAYMNSLQIHLSQYGGPVALYSDKHSIFRVNQVACEGRITQFTRTLKSLDIEPIHAHTPQAKGRVERANQTLQDRLIKEMRLRGIDEIPAANAFLPEFIEDDNQRFSIDPQSSEDAHRAVRHNSQELAFIFTIHHTRKRSKQLTFQFQNREYQIQAQGKGYGMRQAGVTVCEPFEGPVIVLYQGQVLQWRLLTEGEPPVTINDEKCLQHTVDQAKARQVRQPHHKPKPDHPWNKRAEVAAHHRGAHS